MKPLQGRPFESTLVRSKPHTIKAYHNCEYQFSHKYINGEPRHSSGNVVPITADVDRMSHKILSLLTNDSKTWGLLSIFTYKTSIIHCSFFMRGQLEGGMRDTSSFFH